MPLYNGAYYNQKWSMWDTWSAVSRRLKIVAMAAQHRLIEVTATQNRLIQAITAQYRRIIGQTGG